MVGFCYAAGAARLVSAQIIRANDLEISADTNHEDRFDDLQPLLEDAGAARIVHILADDDGDAFVELMNARRRLIRFLHASAGFDVLVLPVGLFEGDWTGAQLHSGESTSVASTTMYRVWRESDEFAALLEDVRQSRSSPRRMAITGGLARFHAAGKALYATQLGDWLGATESELLDFDPVARVERLLGGRGRLSRQSPDARQMARQLVDELLEWFDRERASIVRQHGGDVAELQFQYLRNMRFFIELEQMRAGDLEVDESIVQREKQLNLEWLTGTRYPDRKLIYWEGRGVIHQSLPIAVDVFEIRLSVEPSPR